MRKEEPDELKTTSTKVKLKNEPSNNLSQGFDVVMVGSASPSPGLSITTSHCSKSHDLTGLELGLVVVAKPQTEVEGRGRLQQAGGSRGETGGGAAAARDDWERVRGEKIVCMVASSRKLEILS
nr:hypothetical protein Iba_scaffold8000.4CG1190 [Ipomoea batatas]